MMRKYSPWYYFKFNVNIINYPNKRIFRVKFKFYDIDIEKHSHEGRSITLEFKLFYLIWVYSPNAQVALKRIDYRVNEWDKDFFNYIKELEKKGKPVIVGGDFNVCRNEIDVNDPVKWLNTPGFTKMERDSFNTFLNNGFVDCYRYFHPDTCKFTAAGKYQCKKKGFADPHQGWRIDYFVVSKDIIKSVHDSEIHDNILGSDHVPIHQLL